MKQHAACPFFPFRKLGDAFRESLCSFRKFDKVDITAHHSRLSRTIKSKSHIANAPAEHRQCVVQQKQRCYIADPYHQQRENRHMIILCFLFLMFLFCFSILTLVLPDSTSVSNQFNICENYFDTLEQLIQHLLKKCWNRILQMLERHVENVELLYWNVEK